MVFWLVSRFPVRCALVNKFRVHGTSLFGGKLICGGGHLAPATIVLLLDRATYDDTDSVKVA
jgi:hypothetical protein